MNWKALLTSRTVWSGFVAALAATLSLAGHNVSPDQQTQLITEATNIADAVSGIAGIAAVVFHAKTSVVINPSPKNVAQAAVAAQSTPATAAPDGPKT